MNRKKSLKGIGLLGIIIIVAITAVVVAVVLLILGKGGLGFGGGTGNEEGSMDKKIPVTEEAELIITEPPIIVTEEIKYIEITVSENEYIYQNSKYSLDDLIAELKSQNISDPVKIKDEESSIKAYSGLKEALYENHFHFIETE